jgi:hypothetical protein
MVGNGGPLPISTSIPEHSTIEIKIRHDLMLSHLLPKKAAGLLWEQMREHDFTAP